MWFFIAHRHSTGGHTHSDAGHSHNIYWNLIHGSSLGDDDGSDHFASITSNHKTTSARANIQKGHASIGNPTGARYGEETRPTNMAVVWIMRIF